MPPHPSLSALDHRPWPLPERAWLYDQMWSDLCFLHWPVDARLLRRKLPIGLEVEEFDGSAWIGVVPFRLRIRVRGLPAIPRVQVFPELNVRTYVTAEGRPGVWFFSLDAPSPLAIHFARTRFHLPYYRAELTCAVPKTPEDWIEFSSVRTDPIARDDPAARFRARYRPKGEAEPARLGTLDHFLTERYCLYSADRAGGIHRGEVHHPPWPLQEAEVELEENSMTEPWGIPLEGEPRVAFARRTDVATWGLEAVGHGR